MFIKSRGAMLALVAVLIGGCVGSGTYNAKVEELEKLRGDHTKLEALLAAAQKDRDELQTKHTDDQAKITEDQVRIADLAARLSAVTAERHKLQKSLDDTTALAGQLKERRS